MMLAIFQAMDKIVMPPVSEPGFEGSESYTFFEVIFLIFLWLILSVAWLPIKILKTKVV